MSTKISKEDVKSPDQVTQTLREGFVWTQAHSKLVIGLFMAFLVVGVGYSLASYFIDRKEVAQQEKYYLLEKSYTEKKRGFEEAARAEIVAAQAPDKSKAPAFDPSKKASGDLTKDYGSVVSNFETFLAEAAGTKAGQMAALNLSDIFVTYKKYDEALAALQKVEKGLDKDDMLSALVWMQMGNILANKKDCQGALQKWQAVTAKKSLAFAQDEVKLRMGLCHESLNELDKAEALYSEVVKKEDAGTTDFAASKEAEKYLRVLKAKKNL